MTQKRQEDRGWEGPSDYEMVKELGGKRTDMATLVMYDGTGSYTVQNKMDQRVCACVCESELQWVPIQKLLLVSRSWFGREFLGQRKIQVAGVSMWVPHMHRLVVGSRVDRQHEGRHRGRLDTT